MMPSLRMTQHVEGATGEAPVSVDISDFSEATYLVAVELSEISSQDFAVDFMRKWMKFADTSDKTPCKVSMEDEEITISFMYDHS